jgi:transposase, IS30 family
MGHREAELVVCRRSRPGLVLHESKARATLMSRLAGKTVTAMMATFRRLDPRMRGSVTFDNDTCFARHMMLRGMLSATTNFRDACASWQKGGVENANGRIRRWLPRGADPVLLESSHFEVESTAPASTMGIVGDHIATSSGATNSTRRAT